MADKKHGGIRYQLAIPANLALLFGEQAQQRPQQGGLARADTPGNHHKLPALHLQGDVGNPLSGTWITIAQIADLQPLEALLDRKPVQRRFS